MTPDEARQLIVQAKRDGVTDMYYLDALHTLAGAHYEYAAARNTVNGREFLCNTDEPPYLAAWFKKRSDAEDFLGDKQGFIVRRLVIDLPEEEDQ